MTDQVCEAFNGLHASMHPKRKDLSRTKAGKARFFAAIARSNDGLVNSVVEVMEELGISTDETQNVLLRHVLGPIEEDAEHRAERRASICGKRKRVEQKKARAQRDTPQPGQSGAYGAGVGFGSGGGRGSGKRGRGRGVCHRQARAVRQRGRRTGIVRVEAMPQVTTQCT